MDQEQQLPLPSNTNEATAELVTDEAPAPAKKKPGRKKSAAGTGSQALAQITPELASELEQARVHWSETLQELQAMPLATPQDVEVHEAVCRAAKAAQAQLEEQKSSIIKPLNAAMTATRRLFDPPIEFCKSVERAIKERLTAKLEEQRQRQQAAQDALRTHNGSADAATLAAAGGRDMLELGSGTYEVEDWHAEVVDPVALPAQFWIPNQEMLNDLAKRQKAQANVPGVRFFATRRIVVRS